MKKTAKYGIFNNRQFYIDKTDIVERGIEGYPSIYIEGAAASGKTTVVKMLLERRSDILSYYFDMNALPDENEFALRLNHYLQEMNQKTSWVIFENLNKQLPEKYYELISDFINKMPKDGRTILISHNRPPEIFLELIWKRKMELISQIELRFDQDDIGRFIDVMGSELKPAEVYMQTGGWAGCVDMMVRMSLKPEVHADARVLRASYEVDSFIQKNILDTLSEKEQDLFWRTCLSPWVNESLCENVWGIQHVKEILEDLGRKGIFHYDKGRKYWKLTRMFRNYEAQIQAAMMTNDFWEESGKWYEQNGYIREALECFAKMEDATVYRQCMLRHFEQVPFLEIPYEEVLDWKENTPEICYLRGMYYYSQKNLDGLAYEIEKLEKLDLPDTAEILLNLYFCKPDYPLEDWLDMLEEECKRIEQSDEYHKTKRMRLYHMLGTACTFLCGVRDVTGLFACTKKEENRKAKIWQSCLGDWEWKFYQLARFDYYLETQRRDAILQEDWDVLLKDTPERLAVNSVVQERQFELVRLYLFGKLCRTEYQDDYKKMYLEIGSRIIQTGTPIYVHNAEAIMHLNAPWLGEPERLTRWLRHMESDVRKVSEESVVELWCQAKGYILLNQYEKAEKILRKLIPYQQAYRRARVLSEAWFLQAIVSWSMERRGQALQNTIESFLISGSYRYINYYTLYGKRGREVLEAYMEWHQVNFPEGWHRKKKYQYGNVLRMPLEDYMGVVMRYVRKEVRSSQSQKNEIQGERLTMMELLILQNIGRGLSNTEICNELNLKLPTVKSHIYSMYKKLGVTSRVQAVNKGAEMGVLK